MNSFEILGFTVFGAMSFVGYYYSRNYSDIHLRLLKWFGNIAILVWVWIYYVRHFSHFTTETTIINNYIVRIFWAVTFLFLAEFFLWTFRNNSKK